MLDYIARLYWAGLLRSRPSAALRYGRSEKATRYLIYLYEEDRSLARFSGTKGVSVAQSADRSPKKDAEAEYTRTFRTRSCQVTGQCSFAAPICEANRLGKLESKLARANTADV